MNRNLIDQIGALDEQIKELTKKKEGLIADLGDVDLGNHAGRKYQLSVSLNRRLDNAKAKSELTDYMFNKVTKRTIDANLAKAHLSEDVLDSLYREYAPRKTFKKYTEED